MTWLKNSTIVQGAYSLAKKLVEEDSDTPNSNHVSLALSDSHSNPKSVFQAFEENDRSSFWKDDDDPSFARKSVSDSQPKEREGMETKQFEFERVEENRRVNTLAFPNLDGVYRVVSVVKDDLDQNLVSKTIIEPSELYFIADRFGLSSHIDEDGSSIDFEKLNRKSMEFRGAFGTKLSLLELLEQYDVSLVKRLKEENVSEGIYLKVIDPKKGLLFLWPGRIDLHDPRSKKSAMTVLLRYMFDLCRGNIYILGDELIEGDFDPRQFSEIRPGMSGAKGRTRRLVKKEEKFEVGKNAIDKLDYPNDKVFCRDVGVVETSGKVKFYTWERLPPKTKEKDDKISYSSEKGSMEQYIRKVNLDFSQMFAVHNHKGHNMLVELASQFDDEHYITKIHNKFLVDLENLEEGKKSLVTDLKSEEEKELDVRLTRFSEIAKMEFSRRKKDCMLCMLCEPEKFAEVNAEDAHYWNGHLHELFREEYKEVFNEALSEVFFEMYWKGGVPFSEGIRETLKFKKREDVLKYIRESGSDFFQKLTRKTPGMLKKKGMWLIQQFVGVSSSGTPGRPFRCELMNEAKQMSSCIKGDSERMKKIEKRVLDSYCQRIRNKSIKIKRNRKRLEEGRKINSEYRSIRAVLKKMFLEELKEHLQNITSDNRDKCSDGKKSMKRVYGIRRRGRETVFLVSYEILLEETVQYNNYNLCIEDISNRKAEVLKGVDTHINGVIQKGQMRWTSSSSVKLLLLAETKCGNKIKVVKKKDKGNRTRCFVYFYPKKVENLGERRNCDHQFPFAPEKVCFEESKSTFLVYRKWERHEHNPDGWREEVCVYFVHLERRKMIMSKRFSLDQFYDNIGGENASVRHIQIISGTTRALFFGKDGDVQVFDLTRGTPEVGERCRIQNFEDMENLQMFTPSGVVLVMLYFSKLSQRWTCEARVLNERRSERGFKSFLDIISKEELPDGEEITREAIFSIFINGPLKFLFAYDRENIKFRSWKLTIEVGESTMDQEIRKTGTDSDDSSKRGPKLNTLLNFIFSVFTRFPTVSALNDDYDPMKVHIVLPGKNLSQIAAPSDKSNGEVKPATTIIAKKDILRYMNRIEEMLAGKRILINRMNLSFDVLEAGEVYLLLGKSDSGDPVDQPLGDWMKSLICLIPIQIARHHYGEFIPLSNGLSIRMEEEFEEEGGEDVTMEIGEFAKKIRFGLYDCLLSSINGNKKVYVISCCGKQSSGKSTLLNNIAGTYFDTGAGRCTDGIWLSVRETEDKVFVLLDFEGLGTMEKTVNEDMLSSLFGAGMSHVFIVRAGYTFDRWHANTLRLWGQGARMMIKSSRSSEKIFNGRLLMNPRDVDPCSSEEITNQFLSKFTDELNTFETEIEESQGSGSGQYGNKWKKKIPDAERKVLSMFRGWEIFPTAKINTVQYFEDGVCLMPSMMTDTPFENGNEFLNLSKLFLSQLSFKDFSPIDSHYIHSVNRDVKESEEDAIFGGVSSSLFILQKMNTDEEEKWRKKIEPLRSSFRSTTLLKDYAEVCFNVKLEDGEVEEFESRFKVSLEKNPNVSYRIKTRIVVRSGEDLEVSVGGEIRKKLEEEEEDENNEECEGESDSEDEEENREVEGIEITIKNFPDTGVILGPVEGSKRLLKRLKGEEFWKQLIVVRKRTFREQVLVCSNETEGKNTKILWQIFQDYLMALAERRVERVKNWVESHLGNLDRQECCSLIFEISNRAEKLRNRWLLCGQKCGKCYAPCTLQKSHTGDHNCLEETHRCRQRCEYCNEKLGNNHNNTCHLGRGHPGKCCCAVVSHECGNPCYVKEEHPSVLGCGSVCCLTGGHEGMCVCRAPPNEHYCGHSCGLEGCLDRCIKVYNVEHDVHQCHRNKCPRKCRLCNEECCHEDHFHGNSNNNKEGEPEEVVHLCGKKHKCQKPCSHDGVCKVHTELRFVKSGTLQGHDGTEIEFDKFTEQNGEKKTCFKIIPEGQLTHEGCHICIDPQREEEGIEYHSCHHKCPGCSYYCTKAFGHTDIHCTIHGNMRHFHLEIGDSQEHASIKIFRKSTGETRVVDVKAKQSGEITTCDYACIGIGRGHVHLVPCPYSSREECEKYRTSNDLRHQTCVYEEGEVYDEVKCAYFWKHIMLRNELWYRRSPKFRALRVNVWCWRKVP